MSNLDPDMNTAWGLMFQVFVHFACICFWSFFVSTGFHLKPIFGENNMRLKFLQYHQFYICCETNPNISILKEFPDLWIIHKWRCPIFPISPLPPSTCNPMLPLTKNSLRCYHPKLLSTPSTTSICSTFHAWFGTFSSIFSKKKN